MKKAAALILIASICLLVYNLFLYAFPLKKTVFYTNEERIEGFLYSNTSYPAVIVGSSLSGVFEEKELFEENFFNLYLPFTGAGTGLTVIKRSHKIPKRLFIEINHIDRGVDSSLISSVFMYPIYELKYYLPFLQTKNKVFQNLVDRVKKPSNNKINEKRPAGKLYADLLQKAQSEWSKIEDTNTLINNCELVKQTVAEFAAKGCSIYFYEMPMDSSLTNKVLITYQRNYFSALASRCGYVYIGLDKTRIYQTGDGVHLLMNDALIYSEYFKNEIMKHIRNKQGSISSGI